MSVEFACEAGARPEEVVCQLDRLLADRRFAASERSSRFLQYVVERTLSGNSNQIKEVVIATEIYGRSADYDPKIDSIVRVEASRLRARLTNYYEEEGSLDPIRISIPKGGYIPAFEVCEHPPGDYQETGAPSAVNLNFVSPEPPARRKAFWLCCMITAGLIASFGLAGRTRAAELSARHEEALVAWQEGNSLLALNPHAAASDHGLPATLQRALERYEFAVARDPGFAAGWASLSEAYDYASVYRGRDVSEDARRAEAAARRSIALDHKSASGHAMLGLTLVGSRWKFREGEAAYRRALALDPRRAYAVVEFVDFLRETGRLDEAESELRKGRALLPGLPVLAHKQAELEMDRGQFDLAVATANYTISLKRDYGRAWVALGAAYEQKGVYDEALAAYRRAASMPGELRRALPALGYLLAQMGQTEEARSVLRQLTVMNENVRNCAYQIAVVYAGLGEQDSALEWLERALRTRQSLMLHAGIEYRFQSLRQAPRFRAVVRQIALPSGPDRISANHTINER